MHPAAIILVFISALMHAFRNFYNKQAKDKHAFVWWYEVWGLIFFTPLFIFILYREEFNFPSEIHYIFASGFIHFVYWYLLAKALDKGDLSLVYPIMRSSPVIVLFFSITILGEKLTPLGIMGILAVVSGVYTINLKRFSFGEFCKPMIALKNDRATQFALLTMLSVASYTLVDKIAVAQMHPILFAYLYPWFSLGCFSLYLSKVKDRPKTTLINEWKHHKASILVCGVLSIFGYCLILIAFTLEKMSYIAGLRQLSVVFAVYLGGQLLKESNKRIRFSSATVIFIGTFLIAVAD